MSVRLCVCLWVWVHVWSGVSQYKRQGGELINRMVIVSTWVISDVGVAPDDFVGWMRGRRECGGVRSWSWESADRKYACWHAQTHTHTHNKTTDTHKSLNSWMKKQTHKKVQVGKFEHTLSLSLFLSPTRFQTHKCRQAGMIGQGQRGWFAFLWHRLLLNWAGRQF